MTLSLPAIKPLIHVHNGQTHFKNLKANACSKVCLTILGHDASKN